MKYFLTKLDNEKKYLIKFSDKIYNAGPQIVMKMSDAVCEETHLDAGEAGCRWCAWVGAEFPSCPS